MKSDTLFQVGYKARPDFHTRHLDDAQVGADSRPHATPGRHTSQEERAVMHPDSQDLEWRYCRGGWAG